MAEPTKEAEASASSTADASTAPAASTAPTAAPDQPTTSTTAPAEPAGPTAMPTVADLTGATGIHDEPVEADEHDDRDSSYAESVSSGSYLTSLRSSIRDFKYENGRRYHSFREGAYPIPNDEEEQDRLDLMHHAFLLMLDGSLHRAPLPPKLDRVLDLGTGTGLWAINFADDHPEVEVVGTDLSPIQPAWVPPNCSFEVDDFEADWVYSRPFDYIHARELHSSVSDPARLCRQAYRSLKPGGYIEFQLSSAIVCSDDGTHVRGPHVIEWFDRISEAGDRFGKPVRLGHRMKQHLIDAGFVDVDQYIAKGPMNSWPKNPKLKQLGRLAEVHMVQAYSSYTPGFFSRVLGWDKERIDSLIGECYKELFDRSIHSYVLIFFVWGRKPQ